MKSLSSPCVIRDGPYLLCGVRARVIAPFLLAVHRGDGDDLRDGLRRRRVGRRSDGRRGRDDGSDGLRRYALTVARSR